MRTKNESNEVLRIEEFKKRVDSEEWEIKN